MDNDCTTSMRASFLQIDDDWEAPVAPPAPTPPPLAYSEPVPAELARAYEPQLIRDDPPPAPAPQSELLEAEPVADSTFTRYGVEVLNEPLRGPGATARARRRFGLPEHYRKAAAKHPVTGEPIPKTYFVLDENDNIVVPKSVSEQYVPIQNSAMDVLDDLLAEEGLSLSKGGLWKDGGIPWLMGKSDRRLEGPNGESIEEGVLVKNPQGGLGSFEVVFTETNLFCMNQWGSINRNAKHRFKCKHTKSAKIKIETMRAALRKRGEHRQKVLDYVFSMKRKTLTNKAAVELSKLALGIDLELKGREIPTRQANRLEKFLDIYEHGRAASPGDCYGFVQAATNWASHQFSKTTGLEALETTNAGVWQSKALRHLEAYAETAPQHVQVYVGR